jgi:acetolactate synthase I/II/III large subunit
MRCVVVRLQGACDGYARISRRPAMALLHLGPGLANGLCNLHNARRARSPILVLVGDHATWHASAGGGHQ